MKAIVQDRYGGPEALELAEIDRPPLGDRDALVRMHAASIHFGDQMIMRGKPKLFRPIYGFGKPRNRVPGLDIAGTVEAVGILDPPKRTGDMTRYAGQRPLLVTWGDVPWRGVRAAVRGQRWGVYAGMSWAGATTSLLVGVSRAMEPSER